MASIFISYRREDTGGHAGRLLDRLTARFGDEPIFMDVQDMRPGRNFHTTIDETLASCDCVLVVMGPRWLATVRERAALPDDYVRYEIAAALKRDVPVIPVLVGGARMPLAADLPEDLRALSLRHAIEVRDERFEDDVERLAEAVLEGTGAEALGRRRRLVAAGIVVSILVAVAIAVAMYASRGSAPAAAADSVDGADGVDPIALDGTWVAEMRKPGQASYRVRFDFVTIGDSVAGSVSYPTGDGAVQEGALRDGRLTFQTTHHPQFADGPAVVKYQGEVTQDGIRLVGTDDAGTATGVARRADAP